jgi:predicted Zn finger-like uncharacterized protein
MPISIFASRAHATTGLPSKGSRRVAEKAAEKALEPLITECPNCRTRFRVNESQLTMAHGRVRCGACLSVFTATDNLVIGLDRDEPGTDATGDLDELLDELTRDGRPERQAGAEAPAQAASDAPPPAAPAADAPAGQAQVIPDALALRTDETVPPQAQEGGQKSGQKVVKERTQARANEQAVGRQSVPLPQRAAQLHKAPAVAVPDHLAAAPTATPAAPEFDASESVAEAHAAAIEEIELGTPVQSAPQDSEARPRRPRTKPVEQRQETRLPAFDIDIEAELAAPPAPKRRWWLLPAVVIAALALAAQVLWFQFDTWSRDVRYRPIYEYLCPVVGCELPVLRALSSISSRNLVVRTHPETPNALIVDALLVNEAPFAQPFPLVELRFSSMSGALVAGRRFEPSEYLAGELAGATMMPPNTPVHISLQIEDPGKDAVNYVMVFR